MGGCRCTYKNCQNSTKSSENLHFFHYPVKHKERCKIWIENANKPQFCDLEEDQLKNKVICEVHFQDKYFPNPQKKRLLQSAIPTLDGDSYETNLPSEHITSNIKSIQKMHIQDFQILPANEDGTIFLLETSNMFNKVNRSSQIESYVYKNGNIVPSSNQDTDESKNLIKIENNVSFHEVLDINDVASSMHVEPGSKHNIQYASVPVSLTPLNQKLKNSFKKQIVFPPPVSCSTETSTLKQEETMDVAPPEIPEEQPTTVAKNQQTGGRLTKFAIEKSVGRNYLRKIKQHSRDIATIKRMLKQKNIQPDNDKILNLLKSKLPPTLYTIVELNLNLNCNLTAYDLEFFNTIQTESPNIYKMLIEKYQWKIPDIKKISQSNAS